MKCVLFVVDAGNVRGSQQKPFWLVHAIKAYAPQGEWIKATTLVGAERPQLDSAALYDGDQRVGVIHFLGSYDADGGRLLFCVDDETCANELVEAARRFSQENNDLLHELLQV